MDHEDQQSQQNKQELKNEKPVPAPAAEARLDDNWPWHRAAKRIAYRYALFADRFANSNASCTRCGRPAYCGCNGNGKNN